MLPFDTMEAQVEVTFRGIPANPDIEALVRGEAHKLERYGQKLVSCRVAIEQPQRHQQGGSPFRVRLFIGAGLQQPIVVTREPLESDMHESLRTIVLGAFRAARRQIQSMTERRRGETKALQEPRALVVRLFPGGIARRGLRLPEDARRARGVLPSAQRPARRLRASGGGDRGAIRGRGG